MSASLAALALGARMNAPLPVALDVPAAPIPVITGGTTALVYELHISNLGTKPLRLERIDVQSGDSKRVASYNRRDIERSVKLIGPRGAPAPSSLTPGTRAVFFAWLTFDSPEQMPQTLVHAVVFSGGDSVRGGQTSVRAEQNPVLAPPVDDGDWWIALGPSSTADHRRSAIRVGDDTVPHLAQRFAIDWIKMDAKGEYARDHKGRRNEDWYGYGEAVRAVADARVDAVSEGIPDNTPGENSRAVPMTVATVLGNYVVLDLGAGNGPMHRYVTYCHLKPGSVQVHPGDTVHRGQRLGLIGNSGNSDGPHLHFHVTEAADGTLAPLRSEGVPFVLDSFVVINHDPERVSSGARLTAPGLQRSVLPVEGDVIRINRGR
ncbi:MAG TPA: M23 family metallopeptidase [Gemmatimonadaceae bacterium]|nr:M23 family metallopeptidase [Gemmatimonadaceae bacterium]